jgi:hypothetical protein
MSSTKLPLLYFIPLMGGTGKDLIVKSLKGKVHKLVKLYTIHLTYTYVLYFHHYQFENLQKREYY